MVSNINTPLNAMLTVPARWRTFSDDYWPNQKLLSKVENLTAEIQHLRAKVQKYDALEAEKNRLMVLFSASQAQSDIQIKLGRIIRIALKGPYDQRLVVNRGQRDAVFLSQPVIDANGLIGQVSIIARDHSVVTVITDAEHATPVAVLRNGLNAVARGTGSSQLLDIPFLSFQADIEIGDVLVTSGLGEAFPAGYPVAEVVDIKGVAGEPFLTVMAKPFAELDKVKNILMLDHRALPSQHDADSSEPINAAETLPNEPIADEPAPDEPQGIEDMHIIDEATQ